jgi:hypothetical protein
VNRIIVPVLLVASLAGCHEKKQIAYWPAVRMDDLAAGAPVPNGDFVLLVDQQTEGRFGCMLAIAKLVPGTDQTAGVLALASLHPNEEAYWAEQMRGVAAIQKLVFLRPRSIRPEEQSTATLCDTAVRLGAPLLLVYAPGESGPNSAEVLGVLYDAGSQQIIATLRAASQRLNAKGEEVAPDRKRGDQRDHDAHYQAQREFESHTLACLRELMHRDSKPTTTQPNRWEQPFFERWWLWR